MLQLVFLGNSSVLTTTCSSVHFQDSWEFSSSVDVLMLWKLDVVHGPGATSVGKADDSYSSVVSYKHN